MSRKFKIDKELLKEIVDYKGKAYLIPINGKTVASISTKQGWSVLISSNSSRVKFEDIKNKSIIYEGNEGIVYLRKLYNEKGLEYIEKNIMFYHSLEHFDVFLKINGDIVDSTVAYLKGLGEKEIFNKLNEDLNDWLQTILFERIDKRFKTLTDLVLDCSMGGDYPIEMYTKSLDAMCKILLSLDNDLNKEK